MNSHDLVKQFLNDFHQKMKVWEIVFRDDRSKNTQALLDLELTSKQRIEVIQSLSIEDYSEGPYTDNLNNLGEMWVFGKKVKGVEIYIKISMGSKSSPVICISFHPAEKSLKYPLKK